MSPQQDQVGQGVAIIDKERAGGIKRCDARKQPKRKIKKKTKTN